MSAKSTQKQYVQHCKSSDFYCTRKLDADQLDQLAADLTAAIAERKLRAVVVPVEGLHPDQAFYAYSRTMGGWVIQATPFKFGESTVTISAPKLTDRNGKKGLDLFEEMTGLKIENYGRPYRGRGCVFE